MIFGTSSVEISFPFILLMKVSLFLLASLGDVQAK